MECISIHAPRVRCDREALLLVAGLVYFNPRTSCEVRQDGNHIIERVRAFQSTHLV